MAGLVLLTVSALMAATGIDSLYILPVMLGLGGLAVAWLWFNQEDGQFKAMLGGIALIVLAYMVFVGNAAGYDGASPRVLIAGGLATMVGRDAGDRAVGQLAGPRARHRATLR